MKTILKTSRHVVCAGLVMAAIAAQGFGRNVNLLSTIAAGGEDAVNCRESVQDLRSFSVES